MSAERSPYVVSLTDFVLRFGTSPERRAILDGLLRYRAALHTEGLVQGFQWVDGSFVENVEALERRAPKDVDVVTFYRLPTGVTQQQLDAEAGDLFETSILKSLFHVDGYYVHLGMEAERLTRRSAYWYSAWSHRRDNQWRGFLQLDLAPAEDASAAATLAALAQSGDPP